MKYTFDNILDSEIYDSAAVMFVLGPYELFNSLVIDTLKDRCSIDDTEIDSSENDAEFGLAGDESIGFKTNTLDLATFLDIVSVPSLNGKWYCRVDYGTLPAPQKDKILKYIKHPSHNGVLVVSSLEYKDYRTLLNNKVIAISEDVHSVSLSFPKRNMVKTIVANIFLENNIIISKKALDYFLTRMSTEYNEYQQVIDTIINNHMKPEDIDNKEATYKLELDVIKDDLSGVENYNINDFLVELTKPLSSGKTNNKKVIRMLSILEEQIGVKETFNKTRKFIDEEIEFRILINKGIIPIRIDYFMSDIVKMLDKMIPKEQREENEQYKRLTSMNEWQFRNKAMIAAQTSLKDWLYMKMILQSAYKNSSGYGDETSYKRALYDVVTRSTLSGNRINNIVGLDDILKKDLRRIDRILYQDKEEGA